MVQMKRLTTVFLVMMIISGIALVGLIAMYFKQSNEKNGFGQALQTPSLSEEEVLKETYNQVYGKTFN